MQYERRRRVRRARQRMHCQLRGEFKNATLVHLGSVNPSFEEQGILRCRLNLLSVEPHLRMLAPPHLDLLGLEKSGRPRRRPLFC